MNKEAQFFKTEGGGQFFEVLDDHRVKVISTYDFNPVIEIRRFTPGTLSQLNTIACTEQEFDNAEVKAMQMLDLFVTA